MHVPVQQCHCHQWRCLYSYAWQCDVDVSIASVHILCWQCSCSLIKLTSRKVVHRLTAFARAVAPAFSSLLSEVQ